MSLVTHRSLRCAILLASGLALPGCAADIIDVATSEATDELPALPEVIAAARRARGLGGSPRMTPEQRKQVLDILRMRGVRTDSVAFFSDNAVLVEGDMIVDGPAILQEGASESKKGYFCSGLWPRNVLGNNTIRFVANPSFPFPDWAWLGAFFQAAEDWTSKTNVRFTFAAEPGAIPVTVTFTDLGPAWGCAKGAAAMQDIDDPGEVFINTGYYCLSSGVPACNQSSHSGLPFEVKRKAAIHELMHSIGFGHVGQCDFIPYTGHESELYPSVIYDGVCLDEEPHYTPTLSEDDAWSVNTIYTLPPL